MKLCTNEGPVKTFQNVRNSARNLQNLSKKENLSGMNLLFCEIES